MMELLKLQRLILNSLSKMRCVKWVKMTMYIKLSVIIGGVWSKKCCHFWEEYIPEETGDDIYEMYGDPFGKSLCHAWGASPIYLLGRYFAGIKPTSPGYTTFLIEPQLDCFTAIECTFPVKDGSVTIIKKNNCLTITTTKEGGTLKLSSQEINLEVNNQYRFELDNVLVRN